MKNILLFIIRVFVFFIGFFLTGRLFFLVFNYEKVQNNPVSEILLSNLYALPMDVSAVSYIMLFVFYLIIAGLFFNQKMIRRIINSFIIAMIIISAFINIADCGLASAWGTKINTRALSYLLYPGLFGDAILSVRYFTLTLFFILQSIVFIFIYRKYVSLKADYKVTYLKMTIFAPLLFLILTGIRFGWGLNPIGKSSYIYSENPTLTAATVNGLWNFIHVCSNITEKSSDYEYTGPEEAEKTLKNYLTTQKDTTIAILKNNRPNIIIIMLEGIGAESMKSLGGSENIFPGTDSLSKKGILFTRFYANGFRTEQGLVAMLSGFPAQPRYSIQREGGKILKLPMMSRILSQNGYQLAYYYSNNLKYARADEYLKIGSFKKIYGKEVFKNARFTRSGVYDEYLFKFQLDDCAKNSAPFFCIIQTSSSHEPFDGNFPVIFNENQPAGRYKNAVHYTGTCLTDYIRAASKHIWYANTLYIITSDHGSTYPNNREYNVPLRYQIPLIFFGDVIREEYRGTIIDMPASQIDLPATILSQLGIATSEFEFSKNLFNPYIRPFAFYTFDNGFGIIDRQNSLVFDHDRQQVLYSTGKLNVSESNLLQTGKAFMQTMMERFFNME
jgi:phosphoglycerol transferase MdoB-like AlkP superfamily enzyme